MAERDIEITIGAADETKEAFLSAKQGMEELDRHTRKLNNQLEKMSSASAYAAQGLQRMQSMISGMAFGVVVGAVSAATESLIKYFKELSVTQEAINKLNEQVIKQAQAWKILPEPIDAVTKSTIRLYNADLEVLQLMKENEGPAIQEQIRRLNQQRETLEKNLGIWTDLGEYMEGDNRLALAKNTSAIEKAKVAYEDWQKTMKLMPTTLNEITAASKENADREAEISKYVLRDLDERYKEQERMKKENADREAEINQYVLRDLDERYKEQERMKKEEADREAEINKYVLRDLDERYKEEQRMKKEQEDFYISASRQGFFEQESYDIELERLNTKYEQYALYTENRAELDRWYFAQKEALDERSLLIEMKRQQVVNNMKLQAAQYAAGLLSTLGAQGKEFAIAAIVVQKAAAIAQVIMQTQVAAMAALAPPPIGLGPVAGIALAASIETWGAISVGLIAAQGLAEAGNAMGVFGSASGVPAGSPGGQPIQTAFPAPLTSEAAQPAANITLQVYALDPSSVNWAKLMEEQIVPAMNEYTSRGGTVTVNITE